MRSRLSRLLLSGFASLLLLPIAWAQKPAPPSPPAAAKGKGAAVIATPNYSQESSVIEQLRFAYTFQNDGSDQSVQYAKIRIQGAAALQQWGQLIFTYSASSDKPHIDFVRVQKPDGKVVTAGPDAVHDLSSPVERIAPVFTDIRQIHVTVPDLGVGDTLEYQMTTDTVHPLVPGEFFLQWNTMKQIITLDDTLVVNVPSGRALRVKTSNDVAQPQIRDAGGRRIYTWHTSFTKRPDESSDSDKAAKKKNPQDIQPDVQLSTFKDWAQVGAWYAALEGPRAAVTPEIRAKAEEIVKGQTAPMGKLKAIYSYVSKNIRYVSLSFGVGRYQPHSAGDVLANQYGDCKDKATLLDALLAAENIQSYPVLINFEHKIDPAVPSPGQFDHLINIVTVDGKTYWVDTTPGVAPLGFLMPQLSDKMALAIPPKGPAALERSPEAPPFPSTNSVEVDGSVNSLGELNGSIKFVSNGMASVLVRTALNMYPESFWQKMAEGLVTAATGQSGVKVSDYHFDDPPDLDQPVVFTAKFTAANFLDLTKKDLTLNFSPLGISLPNFDEPDEDSKDPLKLGYPGDSDERWKLDLPAQVTATLPIPVHLTRDYAQYDSSYALSGHTFTLERQLDVKMAEIPPKRYDDFDSFREAARADLAQDLSLENTNPGEGAIPADATADDLFKKGFAARQQNNFPMAVKYFAAAAAKDPNYQDVWSSLGETYLMMQQFAPAIDPLQKAIVKNPYSQIAYNDLGLAYAGLGRYDDAIAQYQKQIGINPLDHYAHANLANVYLSQKKYALAAKEFQTALQITPENYLLNVSLGQAELELHEDGPALDAFQKALQKSPSTVTWNNVAWAMAESSSHLDLATEYSQNSIRATEAQLNAATLGTVGPAQVELTATLPTYWDTMGWIKFKQGNTKAAEEYIHSAWMLLDDATISDHMGQIYEKEGRKEDAERAFAMALLCPNPPVETRGRLAALVGDKKVDAEMNSVRPDLAGRRVVELPNPGKLNGMAQYWVLLGPKAKVSDAKFISGDDKLNGFADALRAAKFPYTIPRGETTQLLLRGALSCSTADQRCAFTPLPADVAVRTTLASAAASK